MCLPPNNTLCLWYRRWRLFILLSLASSWHNIVTPSFRWKPKRHCTTLTILGECLACGTYHAYCRVICELLNSDQHFLVHIHRIYSSCTTHIILCTHFIWNNAKRWLTLYACIRITSTCWWSSQILLLEPNCKQNLLVLA